ncbi:hypothetical protein MXD63_34910 [Frankia sp. Cpl3]|uniref:hypothetical protein n=1 Tax=Parafrankia colletiae TaxID=573497 RepID=UPI0010424B9E|nr:hypothetical protein [Parafrankia colletiae]MCK9905172.1 hypothetical protein [Frankia sp. Cpl3]
MNDEANLPLVENEMFREDRRGIVQRYRLDMPVLPYEVSRPIEVTARSPLNLRKAVEVYGRAIKHECHYDFPLADAKNFNTQHAWLLPHPRVHRVSFVTAGVVSFLAYPDGWELFWMYVHPFARGCGAIERYWPAFVAAYEPFTVQHPISPAGRALLNHLEWRGALRGGVEEENGED